MCCIIKAYVLKLKNQFVDRMIFVVDVADLNANVKLALSSTYFLDFFADIWCSSLTP